METGRSIKLLGKLSSSVARVLGRLGSTRAPPVDADDAADAELHVHEELSCYRGQYATDVIPSHDRCATLARALRASAGDGADGARCERFVFDDRFALVLCEGATPAPRRWFDGSAQLEPFLISGQVRVALVFRFDTSTLWVKGPSAAARDHVRDVFRDVFVGDNSYFAPWVERAPYLLVIEPPLSLSGRGAGPARAIARPGTQRGRL
jgi:hypothetical protein